MIRSALLSVAFALLATCGATKATVDEPDAGSCEASANADGITIHVSAAKCAFHSGEAATFDYTVTVATGAAPIHVDGSCVSTSPEPRAHTHARIEPPAGGDPRYCPDCDVGPCPPVSPADVTLTPGTFTDKLAWPGKSWNGPSDFGAPYGPAFTPGNYEVTVTLGAVVAKLPIKIVR